MNEERRKIILFFLHIDMTYYTREKKILRFVEEQAVEPLKFCDRCNRMRSYKLDKECLDDEGYENFILGVCVKCGRVVWTLTVNI